MSVVVVASGQGQTDWVAAPPQPSAYPTSVNLLFPQGCGSRAQHTQVLPSCGHFRSPDLFWICSVTNHSDPPVLTMVNHTSITHITVSANRTQALAYQVRTWHLPHESELEVPYGNWYMAAQSHNLNKQSHSGLVLCCTTLI